MKNERKFPEKMFKSYEFVPLIRWYGVAWTAEREGVPNQGYDKYE